MVSRRPRNLRRSSRHRGNQIRSAAHLAGVVPVGDVEQGLDDVDVRHLFVPCVGLQHTMPNAWLARSNATHHTHAHTTTTTTTHTHTHTHTHTCQAMQGQQRLPSRIAWSGGAYLGEIVVCVDDNTEAGLLRRVACGDAVLDVLFKLVWVVRHRVGVVLVLVGREQGVCVVGTRGKPVVGLRFLNFACAPSPCRVLRTIVARMPHACIRVVSLHAPLRAANLDNGSVYARQIQPRATILPCKPPCQTPVRPPAGAQK